VSTEMPEASSDSDSVADRSSWSDDVCEDVACSCLWHPSIVGGVCPSSLFSDYTTVVLRKLPEHFTRCDLMAMLDHEGFVKQYDFVYLPTNFKKSIPLGYAIVNFCEPQLANKGLNHFNGLKFMNKTIVAEWSDSVQGLQALVQKYRNSAVMHESVSDSHRPILLQSGVVTSFPKNTEPLSLPPCKQKGIVSKKLVSVPRKQDEVEKLCNRTTLVLRKLPKKLDRDGLKHLLDKEGYANQYDFLYLPMDFAKSVCFGFAIINFTMPNVAAKALGHFADSVQVSGNKICAEWSDSHQGLSALIEKYRNSKVMNDGVLDTHKPLILADGVPVPFPSPTTR